MRPKKLSTLRQISEINMTPLMDLTFILLITFIITFPLIEQGILVNLPKGKAEELDPKEARTISLDAEGLLYLDNATVSREQLSNEMRALGEAGAPITVFVRADETLPYGRVVDVMKLLHDAKITRMALMTQVEE